MATSGSYNFTTTRNDIIQAAFRKIGALGDHETIVDPASANKLTHGINAINPMIKAFMAHGMQLWCDEALSVDMSKWALSSGIVLDNTTVPGLIYKVMRLNGAWRRDNVVAASPIDIPLHIVTIDEYRNLPNHQATGAPTTVSFVSSRTTSSLAIWPMPDTYWQTNGQVILRVQRQLQDFDASTDEPDFPVEWHEALIYNLAVRLAPEYGLAIQDRQQLKQEAKDALDLAKEFDQELGSLFFQPRTRY